MLWGEKSGEGLEDEIDQISKWLLVIGELELKSLNNNFNVNGNINSLIVLSRFIFILNHFGCDSNQFFNLC